MLTRDEILRAVKDPDWQEFRLSLKGLSTPEKLRRLRRLADAVVTHHTHDDTGQMCDVAHDNYIRILNYLNALARGGQIDPLPRQDYKDLEEIAEAINRHKKCVTCDRWLISTRRERKCRKCRSSMST